MTDDSYQGGRRVYRISLIWPWFALIPLALSAASLVYDIASDDTVPVAVPIAVGAGFAALFGFLAGAMLRWATISDQQHLTVRGVFGSHRTLWTDVQGIELEENPAWVEGEQHPKWIAVMYDAAGRRRTLPCLNDRAAPNLEREVAALRETWLRRRGEDWAPVPEAAASAQRARRGDTQPARNRDVSAAEYGLLAGMITFVSGTILFVVLLATGSYGTNLDEDRSFADTWLDPLKLMAVAPAGAFVVTLLTVVVVRRSRRAGTAS